MFWSLVFTGLINLNCAQDALSSLPDSRETFTSNIVSLERKIVDVTEAAEKLGIRRTLVVTELKTKPGMKLKETEIFSDGNADLIIGIDVTGNTEGHMYIAIRGNNGKLYRYDGRLFFRPQQISPDNFHLNDGLILRYKKIPEANRQRMISFMNSQAQIKGPTCVASGSEFIYDVADLDGGSLKRVRPWFPGTFLKYIAANRLRGVDGDDLVPQIYTINRGADTFWNRLPRWKRVWKFIIPVIKNPATWGFKKFET